MSCEGRLVELIPVICHCRSHPRLCYRKVYSLVLPLSSSIKSVNATMNITTNCDLEDKTCHSTMVSKISVNTLECKWHRQRTLQPHIQIELIAISPPSQIHILYPLPPTPNLPSTTQQLPHLTSHISGNPEDIIDTTQKALSTRSTVHLHRLYSLPGIQRVHVGMCSSVGIYSR